MENKIEKLKNILIELDDKYTVSVSETIKNIDTAIGQIVKLFDIHNVVGRSEQLKPKQQICYKINKPCKYDCSGLCKESC